MRYLVVSSSGGIDGRRSRISVWGLLRVARCSKAWVLWQPWIIVNFTLKMRCRQFIIGPLVVLGGELAVPSTRNPLMRGW